MGKKATYSIIIALSIVNVLLLVSCIFLLNKMLDESKAKEVISIQLSDENKQLEDTIAKLQKELAVKLEENEKLKESLLLEEADKAADFAAEDKENKEKENEPIVSYSPDGKYCAEASGTVFSVPAGGLYPYELIYVWDIVSGEIIWGMRPAGYTVEFVWSEDSRYLGVYNTGRIWGESIILDLADRKVINLPSLDAIASCYENAPKPQEDRPDPYIRIVGFENLDTVLAEIKWMDDDSEIFTGQFLYNFIANDITIIQGD